jgi:predicted transposase/invertase (TIGR01784 family)
MVKIWGQYLKENESTGKLPVIIPIVIYQGRQQWEFKSSIGHLFENIENTGDYIPEFKSEIFEISHIPDEKIKGEILLRVHFLIQKYSGTSKISEKIHEILILLLSLSNNRTKTEYLETLLRYLVATNESEQMEDIKTEIEKTIENGEIIMSTIAEKWFQDGVEKGIEQGIEKGIKKNRQDSALKLIEKGMNNELIHDVTGLSIKEIELLRKKP